MDGLIGLIIWIAIISKIVKALKGEDKKKTGQRQNVQHHQYTQQRQTSQQRPVQRTTQAQRDAYYYNQQKSTKERLQQKYTIPQKPVPKSDILSRAKENVQENEPDVMQQQVHAEVCRDFRATAHATSDVELHKELSALCDTGEESDIIKRVNDLIVTGYSGDMNFDRDFIAEGVDMLNQFTV
ncbi:MAG: hypothetical protein IKB01_05675 [Lachnospiraceae bacterium]|nr:hypothetical protein [Lachnospiraceae bacterium]